MSLGSLTLQEPAGWSPDYSTISRYLKCLRVDLKLITVVRPGEFRGKDATTYTVKDQYIGDLRGSRCEMTEEHLEQWTHRLEQRYEQQDAEAEGDERKPIVVEMDPHWMSSS